MLKTIGLLSVAPETVVTVTAPVAMLEKIRGLAKQHNAGTEGGLQMVPADAESLYQSAEQIAVKNARATVLGGLWRRYGYGERRRDVRARCIGKCSTLPS